MANKWMFSVLLIVGTLVGAGCNSTPSDQPQLGSVTGTVTLDGQPLAGALVSFQPETGRGSIGLTDEKGGYTLSYVHRVRGAKVGRHTVTISTPVGDESDSASQLVKERIPAQYNSQTTLTADIKPEENEIDYKLTSNTVTPSKLTSNILSKNK